MSEAVCRMCGKPFERIHGRVLCDSCRIGTCVICGSEFQRLSDNLNKVCCTRKCANEWLKVSGSAKAAAQRGLHTKIEKYGSTGRPSREYTRTCRFCGQEFIAHSPKAEICSREHKSICQVCGSSFVIDPRSSWVSPTCSRKCGQVLAGVTRKQTVQSRYGVDNVMQSEEVGEKLRQSNIEKYGVDNPAKLDTVKEKIRSTFLDHYGVDNPMKVASIRERQQDSVESH